MKIETFFIYLNIYEKFRSIYLSNILVFDFESGTDSGVVIPSKTKRLHHPSTFHKPRKTDTDKAM